MIINQMSEEVQEILSIMEEQFNQSFDITPQKQQMKTSQTSPASSGTNSELQLDSDIINQVGNHHEYIARTLQYQSIDSKSLDKQEVRVEKMEESFRNTDNNQEDSNQQQIENYFRIRQRQLHKQQPQEHPHDISQEDSLANHTNFNPFDEQEDQDYDYYKSLTQNLQKALQKVNSQKVLAHNRNNFYDRIERFEKKRVTQLQLLKRQKEINVERELKKKPFINSKSQKIITYHQPIYLRYEKIIEDKKKKVEVLQAQKMQKQMEEEERLKKQLEEYHKNLKKKIGVPRSSSEYFESMKLWNEGKQKNIKQLAEKEKIKQMNEVSFVPQINGKSKNLMKKGGRVPIYQREIKSKKLLIDEQCTFKPKILKPRK